MSSAALSPLNWWRDREAEMDKPKVVSPEAWRTARIELLAREKEFTRARDALTRERQALPWELVEKDYVFKVETGEATLSDLFDGRTQLIVYHFMFGPDWDEGCKSCSFIADHFEPAVVHLHQRDINFVAVSRAPLEKLLAFRERMGWSFPWASSLDSEFNWDFHVSFTPDELESGTAYYNYAAKGFSSTEGPGLSVFARDRTGDVFHTYSSFGRGLDMFIAAYHYLDIVPKGRDEGALDYTMAWLRHHDRYDR